jgi:hypothetical protein
MRKPIALLALGLIAACGPKAQEPQAPPSAPMVAAPESFLAGEAGIGPITAQAPFEAAAMETLFPGAHVEASVMMDRDGEYPILTVMGAGLSVILEVDGGDAGRITAVRVLGGRVRGPSGETLMTPWAALAFEPQDCAPGQNRELAALVCRRPAAPNLAYIIGIRGWSGPGTPAPEKLTADGFLREMLWTPPA